MKLLDVTPKGVLGLSTSASLRRLRGVLKTVSVVLSVDSTIIIFLSELFLLSSVSSDQHLASRGQQGSNIIPLNQTELSRHRLLPFQRNPCIKQTQYVKQISKNIFLSLCLAGVRNLNHRIGNIWWSDIKQTHGQEKMETRVGLVDGEEKKKKLKTGRETEG